jgi:hypothetical protein
MVRLSEPLFVRPSSGTRLENEKIEAGKALVDQADYPTHCVLNEIDERLLGNA